MAEPTPGMWRAVDGVVVAPGDRWVAALLADAPGKLFVGAADLTPEDRANLQLLALAPQMLRALRGIVADVQSKEGWQDRIGVLISGDYWAMAVDAVQRMAPAAQEDDGG